MKYKAYEKVILEYCKTTYGSPVVYKTPGHVTDFTTHAIIRMLHPPENGYVVWVEEFAEQVAVHESYLYSLNVTINTKLNGMSCIECKNGYPMAEANYGDKLVCWSCRDSLKWKYEFKNNIVTLKD